MNNLLKIWKPRQALMASAKSSRGIVQANWSNKKKRAYRKLAASPSLTQAVAPQEATL
jgi:hypothetical protein